ncbi:MAG: SAM-dependent methyltransferase [Hyphomicrobiales bacterium]|nr:SAM-dependent methyltransferase [Hyphomicrobiales bacterium]
MVSMTLFKRSAAAALCLATVFSTAAVAQPAENFQPTVGQRGKDVVWVPSPQALVDRMLDMAKLTPNDFLMDLGSGDGRTVITAAKRGARALGIEYNPDMVELAKANAQKEGVADKAAFEKADLFETDFSRATVLTLFLLPDINRRLRPKILDLKPGTRVVSNTFDMGDWTPDETAEAGGNCTSYCRALFWIVPAKAEGSWKSADGEVTLEQRYQMLTGTVKAGNVVAPITQGKVTGETIAFTAGGKEYSGRIAEGAIEGVVKAGSSQTPWKATRAR